MAAPVLLRPALACASVLILGGCSAVEGDAHRFESMARAVAEIEVPMTPVSRDAPSAPRAPPSQQSGLRPALQVQVMEPHDLWDARDGVVQDTIQGAVRQAVVRTATEAAPAVVRQASERVGLNSGLRPAVPAPRGGAVIQLGAFSTPAAARAAWADASRNSALAGLTPRYEAVQVNGKPLTRLKVGPIPADAAAQLCRAARVSDPWCRRAG